MGTVQISKPNVTSLPPLSSLPKHNHAGHSVQFYLRDEFLMDEVSKFVGGALGSGSAAIVIATKAHRVELDNRLRSCGFDVSGAMQRGRYIPLDAAETLAKFMVNSWPDETKFVEVVGSVVGAAVMSLTQPHRVAAFGEMVALLWAEGKVEAAVRLEELWNELAKRYSFSLLCAYPMSGFHRHEHGEPFLQICAAHSSVVPGESYTSLASDEERLRNVSHLQQRSQALETESIERKQIQKSLQRRETELTDILENAVEGIQQVGPDQRILWTNKALLNLLGYSREEYIGGRLSDFHARKEVFDEFWSKLMRREDIYDFPAELRCKDGSIRQVLIHSNGLWEDGQFVHTRCFVRDVTHQNQMEQALRGAEKHAAMGRLAATIAHEINNPLEAVRNIFYLLRDHPSLDGYAKELARIADEEMSRVGHIAKQTLAFYRESAVPVPLSLGGVIDEVLNVYGRKLYLQHISIDKQFAAGDTVIGFPSEIRQVFLNLIGNSMQAMPQGGTLRISVRHTSQTGAVGRKGILVNVTDTGSGVAPEYRDKLFQPFVTTKAEKGTGLGLWVSRGIIQKLDGTIRFRSGKVRGKNVTSFAVFIPAEQSVANSIAV